MSRLEARIRKLELAAAKSDFGRPRLKWQAIDTAPRDGSWFITYCDGDYPYDVLRWVIPADGEQEDGYFVCANGDEILEESMGTHWMPFPSAPE